MKRTAFLLLLLIAGKLFAGDIESRTITITGKVDHYDPKIPVLLGLNRLGFYSEEVIAQTDSLGNFYATAESYIPLDFWITYKTNFQVLAHPGDSIFVRFDGACNDRPELLQSIRFEGTNTKQNQDAATFQRAYFAHEIYWDWNKKNKAVKEYEPDQYLCYLDSTRAKGLELYDRFVRENKPDEETKKWASAFLDGNYYMSLALYAGDHRNANGMNFQDSWDVPKGFYKPMLDFMPVDHRSFISAYALNQYSEWIHKYFIDELRGQDTNGTYGILPGGGFIASSDAYDSIYINRVILPMPDPLVRQINLTSHFNKKFLKQEIEAFEQYKPIVDQYITEPFLREPLYQRYQQTKSRIENPELQLEAVLKKAEGSSVKQIIDEILQTNKGKVIYMDFWGTWCAPCLSEMPNSKTIETALHGKEVAFVYICLESKEGPWKACLDKFQLGGQHYLLSLKQSSEIRRSFDLDGVPFYVLIDAEGTIVEKGSHLRPLNAKVKIESLIK